MSNISNYTTEDDQIGPAKFFLVEDDIVEDWYPRWYYIFENKTTGKMYLGQTRRNVETYCGSGRYWLRHCRKHGGLNRFNIIAIWTRFFELEEDARKFLNEFEEEFPNYWSHKNTEWANSVPENTKSFPCCGGNPEVIEKMKETKRKNKKPLTPEQLARKKEAMNRPEVKEKLRRNAYILSGADNPSSKQVTIDGITYDSMRAASKATGLTIDYIRKVYIKGIIRQEPTEEELLRRFEQRSQITKRCWESDEYRKKLLSKIMPKAENHYYFKGYYVTPFGKFSARDKQNVLSKNCIGAWCKDKCDSLVSIQMYNKSNWLQENYVKEDIVGKKTFRELGFWFEEI